MYSVILNADFLFGKWFKPLKFSRKTSCVCWRSIFSYALPSFKLELYFAKEKLNPDDQDVRGFSEAECEPKVSADAARALPRNTTQNIFEYGNNQ